jgi:hypothetical protein
MFHTLALVSAVLFQLQTFPSYQSHGSSASIVTRLRSGRLRFDSRKVHGIFLFATASRPALGPTQFPFQCVRGALFPELKQPGREADHSPPSGAEVNKAWR